MKTNKLLLLAFLALPLFGCNEVPTSSTTETPKEDVYFNITIQEVSNGTITCDKERVKQGDLATFYFTANEGYEIETFFINDKEYSTELGHYTVVNVQEDLVAKATFGVADIVVRYIVDDEVIQSRKVKAGTDASYIGKTPTRDFIDGKVFEFDGWSLSNGGALINSFVFTKSTDIYGVFSEKHYSITMAEALEIRTLHVGDLAVTTDYPEYILKDAFEVEDETICTVDANYKVHAVKSGQTNINFKVGVTAIKSCHVTITNIDNVRMEKCYASGYVSYNDNNSIGQFNACQTLIKDLNGNNINSKEIDFEGDFVFSRDISSSDNFGIQVNKEINAQGNVTKCFQFCVFSGDTNNVMLKVNGSVASGTTTSHHIEAGVTYNLRVVTTAISTGVNVKCYIDGVKVIDSNRGNLNGSTNYIGLRYANSNNNFIQFSNLHLN